MKFLLSVAPLLLLAFPQMASSQAFFQNAEAHLAFDIAPPAPVQAATPVQIAPIQHSFIALDVGLMRTPPDPWAKQDSADLLYRRGKQAIDDERYQQAAQHFGQIHSRFPQSVYTPDSYYWEGFSLYRLGSNHTRRAIAALDVQQEYFPRARTASDGLVLATRLRGQLARTGDKQALYEIADVLERGSDCSNYLANAKVAALNALQQVDDRTAMRYLRRVFDNTADCETPLRPQAVFVLSQVRMSEANELLITLARRERDRETREQAVHWLSQIDEPEAKSVLRNILSTSYSSRLKEHAFFSFSTQASFTDIPFIQTVAASSRQPSDVRVSAINWLAGQTFYDQSRWLRDMYTRERSDRIRIEVVRAIAERRNAADVSWLLVVVADSNAVMPARRIAVSAAAQLLGEPARIFELYNQVAETELREEMLTVLAQKRDPEAVERLIAITRAESDDSLRVASLQLLRQSKDPVAIAFLSTWREREK